MANRSIYFVTRRFLFRYGAEHRWTLGATATELILKSSIKCNIIMQGR